MAILEQHSPQHSPVWRRPGLALLAGVATVAVAAGASAGYWAGARAAGAARPDTAASRMELDGIVERLAALERVQELRLLELTSGSAGDLDPAAAEPSAASVPSRSAPGPDAEPDLRAARAGRFAGGPARWIESLEALQSTRDPVRRKELARELAQSPIPPLRLEAVRTLLEIDADEGLAAVRELVAEAAQNPRAQRMAMQAVSLLEGASGRAVDETLLGFTASGAVGVQRAALRTLEQRGDAEPMQASLAAQRPALTSKDAGTRTRALREIGALRSPSALPMIVSALGDADSGVRIQALESLGRTGGGAPAVAAVEPLLSDPVPAVRDTAVRTVQRLNRGPEEPEPSPRGFRSAR